KDMQVVRPLRLKGEEEVDLHVVLSEEAEGYRFEVSSQAGEGGWRTHLTGYVTSQEREGKQRYRAATGAKGDIVGGLSGMGIEWGPNWNAVKEAVVGEGQASGEVVSEELNSPLPPRVLDAALGISMLPLIRGGTTYLPFSVEELVLHQAVP